VLQKPSQTKMVCWLVWSSLMVQSGVGH